MNYRTVASILVVMLSVALVGCVINDAQPSVEISQPVITVWEYPDPGL